MANALYSGDFIELIALHDLIANGHSYKWLGMFSTLTKSIFSSFTPETNIKLIDKNFLVISENKFVAQVLARKIKRQGWLFYYVRLPGDFWGVLFNKHILPLYQAVIVDWFFYPHSPKARKIKENE